MLKRFGKIREKWIAEKKLGRYLLYALGEIVLIVIGILIALWISNWNEAQKDARAERAFLVSFRNDLQTDVQTLSDKMRSNAERINHTDSIISVLSERDQLSEAERLAFSRWNMSLAFESYFIPEKSTISQFEASDNGHLIAEALKDKLFSYYATNERLEANVERSMQLYQHNFLTKEILQNILGGDITRIMIGSDLGRPDFDLNDLKQNSEYIFALITKKVATTNQNDVYRRIKRSAEELIGLIDAELDE